MKEGGVGELISGLKERPKERESSERRKHSSSIALSSLQKTISKWDNIYD